MGSGLTETETLCVYGVFSKRTWLYYANVSVGENSKPYKSQVWLGLSGLFSSCHVSAPDHRAHVVLLSAEPLNCEPGCSAHPLWTVSAASVTTEMLVGTRKVHKHEPPRKMKKAPRGSATGKAL